MTLSVLSRGWRTALESLAGSARQRLLIASPYIKRVEADWLCQRLRPYVRLTVLTDVATDSVQGGSLDIEALRCFADFGADAEVITLGRLHAKVFVADTSEAVVTSGNLTTAGLDWNYEYGLRTDDRAVVTKISEDVDAYARLGSRLNATALAALQPVGGELRAADRIVQDSASAEARRRFRRALNNARAQFVAAQVGDRSSNAVFGEAILLALREGPLATTALGAHSSVAPDLCDDTRELTIHGQHFGKAWKHSLRNAQQSLKSRGAIAYDGSSRLWSTT